MDGGGYFGAHLSGCGDRQQGRDRETCRGAGCAGMGKGNRGSFCAETGRPGRCGTDRIWKYGQSADGRKQRAGKSRRGRTKDTG